MLRRLFVLFPAALFAAARSDAKKDTLEGIWNDFSAQVSIWVPMAQEFVNTPGESPIRLQHEWERVRRAFHDVDVFVRNL